MGTAKRRKQATIRVGWAADDRGFGIVYARRSRGGHVLRGTFHVERGTGLGDREVGYAALATIAAKVHEHGVTQAIFDVDDAQLVADLTERRDLPVPLMLPYVRLRCAMNLFESYDLRFTSTESDLSARALAEVSLHLAA